jgi:S-adenosylmethionine decarboxylase
MMGMHLQFGVHLMIDGYGCCPSRLADREALERLLDRLPEELGMHPIAPPMVVEVGAQNRKDPGGLSGFVMIAESHLSFHTFPARRFISIDVYTCQDDLDCAAVAERLRTAFGIEDSDVHIQRRGLRYPAQDVVPLRWDPSAAPLGQGLGKDA